MAKTSNETQAAEPAGINTGINADTHIATHTMLVEFRGTDRRANTVTYVQRAVGITGVVRHFALTVQMTPRFRRKVLRAGPLPPGTMVHLTLEQTWDDDRVCTSATDLSLAADTASSPDVPDMATSAG